jgi:hypothetical protein
MSDTCYEIVAQKPQAKQSPKREPIPYQVSPRRIDFSPKLSLRRVACGVSEKALAIAVGIGGVA